MGKKIPLKDQITAPMDEKKKKRQKDMRLQTPIINGKCKKGMRR